MLDTVNLLSGGGIVGGVVAAVASFGWWLRRERVESAKANNTISSHNASANTYKGQANEIAALRERLTQIESAYVAQAAQMGELLKKISELEAKIVGISAHHDNLILCEVCLTKNERILDALNKTLKSDAS